MKMTLVQRNADFIQWNLTDGELALWILANSVGFVSIKEIHFKGTTEDEMAEWHH